MSEVNHSVPHTPSETQKLYREEYQHGASLFEKALQQSRKTSYDPKKEQFEDVMKMAMEILNQAARGLKDEGLIEQNKKIQDDYKAYQANPNQEHLDALQGNLRKAKDSLE